MQYLANLLEVIRFSTWSVLLKLSTTLAHSRYYILHHYLKYGFITRQCISDLYLGATEINLGYTLALLSRQRLRTLTAWTLRVIRHTAYKQPLANYIDSLVTLGGAYWDTMQSAASFVGVGIQGVTVPLRDGMTVPTNNNFVAADLDQLTGLLGDASTKFINTNWDHGTSSQDDFSVSVYPTTTTTTGYLFGAGRSGVSGVSNMSAAANCRNHAITQKSGYSNSLAGNISGSSRSSSTGFNVRSAGTDFAATVTSQPPLSRNLFIFSRTVDGSDTAETLTNARLATYHAGPALDLATLEGLQETLITEVAAAKGAAAAANYFARLDTAGDTTYVPYKQPLTNYISSLVALGGAYWDTMESAASFVGVGIQGITVPLRDGMPSITNNNFVAGDLNQLTGLKGGTGSKSIDTNTVGTDYAQDDASLSVYASTTPTVIGTIAGDSTVSGGMQLRQGASTNIKHSCHGAVQTTVGAFGVGILGVSRDNSANYNYRTNATNGTLTQASVTVASGDITLFGASGVSSLYDGRLATYHAGPALDLATLEGLQETLLAEIAGIGFSTEAANYFGRLVNAGDYNFLSIPPASS